MEPETIPEDRKPSSVTFLMEQYRQRENRRIECLMKMSGIKSSKLLSDFDWNFNPKVPRDKIMEFTKTDSLKNPPNLAIIGPAGAGKTLSPRHCATTPS
jgi:DNA replication protein DnaC